ncbi:MAG: hypothetical protein OXP75_01810 [Rhodospirillales bacterium]|nr:hypothetical protein [Rhodospirillales bacterium]
MVNGSRQRRYRAARLGATLLAASVLVALAGCNPFADPPPCPRVSILKEARLLTLYGDGPGREASDVAFVLELRSVSSDCDYDVGDQGGGVEVTFALPIRATRGPAAASDRVSVPFFVAIADPTRQIIAKEVFTAQIAFEADSASAQTVEEIEQWIPLGPGEFGVSYETLVGFQLTPAQLGESQRPRTQ